MALPEPGKQHKMTPKRKCLEIIKKLDNLINKLNHRNERREPTAKDNSSSCSATKLCKSSIIKMDKIVLRLSKTKADLKKSPVQQVSLEGDKPKFGVVHLEGTVANNTEARKETAGAKAGSTAAMITSTENQIPVRMENSSRRELVTSVATLQVKMEAVTTGRDEAETLITCMAVPTSVKQRKWILLRRTDHPPIEMTSVEGMKKILFMTFI